MKMKKRKTKAAKAKKVTKVKAKSSSKPKLKAKAKAARKTPKPKARPAKKKPVASRKPAAPARMAAVAPAAAEHVEKRVWDFSTSPRQDGTLYMDPFMAPSLQVFKDFSVGDLVFHKRNLDGPALDTEVELFAKRLHAFLEGNGIAPTGDAGQARGAVEEAAREKGSTITEFLGAVTANYR